jgi:cytoskeletal protein RodZ
MTVGTELRQARERAGLSVEEISERTKIHLYKVVALDNGTFELLPHGI